MDGKGIIKHLFISCTNISRYFSRSDTVAISVNYIAFYFKQLTAVGVITQSDIGVHMPKIVLNKLGFGIYAPKIDGAKVCFAKPNVAVDSAAFVPPALVGERLVILIFFHLFDKLLQYD